MLCCTTVWCSAHSNNPFSEAAATVWWSEFLGNAFHSWQQLLQVFPGNILAITPNKYSWKNKTKIIIIKYTCTAWGQVTDAKKERRKKIQTSIFYNKWPQSSAHRNVGELKPTGFPSLTSSSLLCTLHQSCILLTRFASKKQAVQPRGIKFKNTDRSPLKYQVQKHRQISAKVHPILSCVFKSHT